MKNWKIVFGIVGMLLANNAQADSLFFEDSPVQGGLHVFEVSETFADIYQKLDSVSWGGKNINVAIESLEKLSPRAHIAATDERIVLVWKDEIVANYPRPESGNWKDFGEITTAIILKMRERDAFLQNSSESDMYQMVVTSLMQGIDEAGRYIFSRQAQVAEDNRILTSCGIEGERDVRGDFRVTGVYKDSPADFSGIKAGDLITAINGVRAQSISDAEFKSMLTGYNAGTLKLHLATPSGDKDVVLRRATIVLADADVVHRDMGDAGAILEIIVHNVSDGAVAIVGEALKKYDDATGIILDMRTATGGEAKMAAKFAGLFLGGKPVMRIVETAKDEVEVVPSGDAVTDVPVVALMSNMTRGTPEAILAALYENERAVLVGTPTAGNVRISTHLDLNNGGALELYNKVLKTGTGRVIDGRGVFPIVCLSNIRSAQQQNVFFVNVINNDFHFQDFNKEEQVSVDAVRRGCPIISSGNDEDMISSAVAIKILTDKKVYNKLVAEEE